MITQLQKGKNRFYQISLAMLVAMISIAGCTKKDETPKPTPTPVITDFKATSGWVGDVVTITGTDFGIDVANNIVKFGDKVATVSTATITELKVTVPTGATTGKISVTVNGVTGTSTTDFMVNTETVYIAGDGGFLAGYWKNGGFVRVGNTTGESLGTSMVVVGNDIYVAGTQSLGFFDYRATYWKNGVAVAVGNNINRSGLEAIIVIGSDVYVAGYEQNTALKNVAKYWKNGVPTSLTDGINSAVAKAIKVVGSDVYVAGYDNNNFAKYWKNGIAVNFGSAGSYASSIFVLGNDVYVGGSESNTSGISIPKYWKNGVATTLGNIKGDVSSIKVVGNDVYAVGYEINPTNNAPIAKYWKNGIATNLTNGLFYATATSIQIIGNDIYIVGTENRLPRYWKNSVSVEIKDSFAGAAFLSVTGIVVIP